MIYAEISLELIGAFLCEEYYNTMTSQPFLCNDEDDGY